MRRTVLAALCLLLLTACTAVVQGTGSYAGVASGGSGTVVDVVNPDTPVAEHDVQEIAWHDCTDLLSKITGPGGPDLTYDCGVLQVPVDYFDPASNRMPIAMIRVHLAGTSGQQPLLVNPGGPGAGGIDLAVGLGLTLDEQVLAGYDIVGFDPRGTGQSQPIQCLDTEAQDAWVLSDPAPQTPEGQEQLKSDIDSFAQACKESYFELEHLNTMATARDMDQIREALGLDLLNYLGYSYGTELGSVYATLFPDRVGAFVLDGAVDMQLSRVDSFEEQIVGFENAFDRFAADCVAKDCPVAPDPRQTALDLLAASRTDPLTGPDGRIAGPAVVVTAMVSAMYTADTWPDLADALADAADGDAAGLFELADAYWGRYETDGGDIYWSNLLDANAAINCADTAELVSFADAVEYAQEWGAKYPLFGADSGFALYGCTPWPTTRYPVPDVDASDAATPILVVGTTNDPATPYSGAISLTEDLGGDTVLLTYDGDGHTAYPGDPCINAAVQTYLLDGTLPAPNTTCP